MKKLYLIKNQELFQGEKYLGTKKNYFEGWYFKNTTVKSSISFIPGISIDENGSKAFIQVITNSSSYFVDYDIKDFVFSYDPFYIKIKDNYFSSNKIYINIVDDAQKINIYGKIKYSQSENIKTDNLNPNIMGLFSYIPFMECNHAIISMKNKVKGLIRVNNKKIKFNDGIGYIEKDWGYSFPKTYLWCQGNNFKDSDASFMLSVADIPFKLFKFKGIISVLIVDGKEYRFATYNGAKLIKYEVSQDLVKIVVQKKDYYLSIKSKIQDGYSLIAPVNGGMSKNIKETINADIDVTLRNNEGIIFSDRSINCGLEIV